MTVKAKSQTATANYNLNAVIAGTLSALLFLIVHDLTISNIWFSTPIALAAGALCGLSLAWSYSHLLGEYSVKSWLAYNLLYLAAILIFAGVSIIIFEPVATMAELSALDGPPHDLIAQAMPVTIIYTLISAAVITFIYSRSWTDFMAVLLTTALLVILLGLNVSVLGFVDIPLSAIGLLFKFLGLIVMLNVAFFLGFIILQVQVRR